MTEHAHHTTHHHKQHDENGLAITSFILGIVAFTGPGALTGIPAIITGFMSLKNPRNKGLGIAGLVMGIITTVFTLLLVLLFILFVAIGLAAEPSLFDDSTPSHTPDSSRTRSI